MSILIHTEVHMETITAIEAVRKATDPYGVHGERTAAMRPSASEVIERLAELGFVVARADVSGAWITISEARKREGISESELRVLDGNR